MITAATPIVSFLQQIYTSSNHANGTIAVSGGIDSAVSLTLLTQALGPDHVFPVLLPYGDQSIEDSKTICTWNKIPESNVRVTDIASIVDLICTKQNIVDKDPLRKGNIMARVRMILLYDYAREKNALVCGTENKSEKYLGYFTRFGDEASDIEPLQHLYKSEIRALATHLELPPQFLSKAPSAGLWAGQTDELELGFSYDDADKIIAEYLQEKPKNETISEEIRTKVLGRITSQHFKHEVPYTITSKI